MPHMCYSKGIFFRISLSYADANKKLQKTIQHICHTERLLTFNTNVKITNSRCEFQQIKTVLSFKSQVDEMWFA